MTLGRVRVSTSKREYKAYERINAHVTNSSKRPITYCVDIGEVSFKIGNGSTDDLEVTPIPFYVQVYTNRAKWSTRLSDFDLGHYRHAEVLESGQTLEFTSRLSHPGQIRLVMEYWAGEHKTT